MKQPRNIAALRKTFQRQGSDQPQAKDVYSHGLPSFQVLPEPQFSFEPKGRTSKGLHDFCDANDEDSQ